jgi:hypothetical protein
MRTKVYVIQEVMRRNPRTGDPERVHNLLPALKFGELVFLLDNRRFPISAGPVTAELRAKLAEYTEQDYIVPVGNPVYIGIVCALAAERTGGKFRLLKWDKPTEQYIEVFCDIGG